MSLHSKSSRHGDLNDEVFAAPDAAARVGRNYPTTSGNPCPSATILPLSSDRATLKSRIRDLSVVGSTAGQIGMAWGWYAVSPNFNGLWPGSPAGAYAPEDTLKAVIIMTDGEFNTPYNSGVIAVDAGRNLAVLVEAAVRNTVLQLRGIDTYQEFVARHQRAMERGEPPS